MNIGIDARLLERKITGIGRFLLLILNKLPQVDGINKYFLFSYDSLKFRNDFYVNISTINSKLPQKIFSPIWNNLILPFYLKKNKIDLFFSVNQIIPLVKITNIKYISVVHDVIYKADKKFLPIIYRMYLQLFAYLSIKSSDSIVTVSEYSKMDILKHYNIDEKKIKVIYAASDNEFYPMNLSLEERQRVRNLYNLPEKIILYVGMIENRKNILGILSIADQLLKKNKEIRFLIIGKIGYGGEKLLKEIQRRSNVIYLKSVSDLELKKIYNIATLFLFPSFYEGFGFPPLEAMQSGLPVLASNNTSLKEIIGSGGLLGEPKDYDFFVNNILKLISDNDYYELIRKQGIERAQKFDITNTVVKLVDTFNEFNRKN